MNSSWIFLSQFFFSAWQKREFDREIFLGKFSSRFSPRRGLYICPEKVQKRYWQTRCARAALYPGKIQHYPKHVSNASLFQRNWTTLVRHLPRARFYPLTCTYALLSDSHEKCACLSRQETSSAVDFSLLVMKRSISFDLCVSPLTTCPTFARFPLSLCMTHVVNDRLVVAFVFTLSGKLRYSSSRNRPISVNYHINS